MRVRLCEFSGCVAVSTHRSSSSRRVKKNDQEKGAGGGCAQIQMCAQRTQCHARKHPVELKVHQTEGMRHARTPARVEYTLKNVLD